MKISFDFDGCLSTIDMQTKAIEHINQGDDVWIVTSRDEVITQGFGDHNDLFAIAQKLGLRDKIIFTNHQIKSPYLSSFDVHYDDNPNEIDELIKTSCKGILI
jgi:hypothetical protein